MPTKKPALSKELAQGKAKTIHDFLDAIDDIREKVKEDLLSLMKKIPLEVLLSDDGALEEYMGECIRVVMRRYVVTTEGVTPEVSKAIKGYVKGMM